MRTPTYTTPLEVLSVRVSRDERALIDALATVTQSTASQVARELLRSGAPSRLRESLGGPDRADPTESP